MNKTTKIAVLVSGGGTNLQALIDAEKRGELGAGKIGLVLASKPGVYALERAAQNGIDSVVLPRKEYADKPLSDALEGMMENRSLYVWREGEEKLGALRDGGGHFLSCVMPILSEGDIIGCVASLMEAENDRHREMLSVDLESKLIQTAAGFLGRQLES